MAVRACGRMVMWLWLCHSSVSQCAIGACHSSVPQGMGMWQTLGLGHLGQLVHFLSSIIHHDGGFGEHGHLPPSTHTPYEPPKYAFPTVNEVYNMIIALHLVLCHIT